MILNRNKMNKKLFQNELLTKQLDNVPLDKKLSYKDICRITKYINKSLFGETCSLWNGYVTNSKNGLGKGLYVNFYFRNKKVALHRLLYENFISPVGNDEYLKYSCVNKAKCCNINHMIKLKYIINENKQVVEEENKNIKKMNIELIFD